MYEYSARPVCVIDGDTIDVITDLGFQITRKTRLRLKGVDTHETYGVDHDTEEYRRGKRETEYVRDWLPEDSETAWPLIIRTEKRGSFGRYLATVELREDGAVLNDDLLSTFDDVAYE